MFRHTNSRPSQCTKWNSFVHKYPNFVFPLKFNLKPEQDIVFSEVFQEELKSSLTRFPLFIYQVNLLPILGGDKCLHSLCTVLQRQRTFL